MGFLVSGRMPLDGGRRLLDRRVRRRDRRRPGAVGDVLRLAALLPHTAGLGADGFGKQSIDRHRRGRRLLHRSDPDPAVRLRGTGRHQQAASPGFAGLAIGLGLDRRCTSSASRSRGRRSTRPGAWGRPSSWAQAALSQVWLFIVAPLVGGAIAALLYRYFFAEEAPRSRRSRPSRPLPRPPEVACGGVAGLPRRPLRRRLQHQAALAGDPTQLRWREGVDRAAGRHRRPGPRTAPASAACRRAAGWWPRRRRAGPGRRRLVLIERRRAAGWASARCPGPGCPAGCARRSKASAPPTSSSGQILSVRRGRLPARAGGRVPAPA